MAHFAQKRQVALPNRLLGGRQVTGLLGVLKLDFAARVLWLRGEALGAAALTSRAAAR